MRKQQDRHGAFGDVEQRDGNRVLPAQNAIDVSGAEVLRAMVAQVDPAPELAGDIAGRRSAE